MAILLPHQHTIVTAAPGTGSPSLAAAAMAVPGSRRVAGEGDEHALASTLAAHELIPSGLTIVTGVRNPFHAWLAEWHRARSRWSTELSDPDSWVARAPGMADQVREAVELPFSSWLERRLGRLARSGTRRHLDHGHVDEAHIVLQREELWRAPSVIGDWFPSPPRLNVSGPVLDVTQHYDAAARRLVEQVHAPTLERFGYRFEPDEGVARG